MLHASIKCIQHHSRAQGYVQNAFTALMETSDDDDNNVQTVMTQMAALTTQSQQMAHTVAERSASVAAAINQLAANQQIMQQQFAAFTMQRNTSYQRTQVVQSPIAQFLIPNFASFPSEGCSGGRRGGSGRVDMQILGAQVAATYAPHSQTLSDAADKGACPP
jgi:hypothetical protein